MVRRHGCPSGLTYATSLLLAPGLCRGETNLGVLEGLLAPDVLEAGSQAPLLGQAPAHLDSLASQPLYVDGGAVFASSLLLALLLYFSLDRIFGLERLWKRALGAWLLERKYRQRNEAIDDRQRLERLLDQSDSGDEGAA